MSNSYSTQSTALKCRLMRVQKNRINHTMEPCSSKFEQVHVHQFAALLADPYPTPQHAHTPCEPFLNSSYSRQLLTVFFTQETRGQMVEQLTPVLAATPGANKETCNELPSSTPSQQTPTFNYQPTPH
jgi:hypothetical protein